MNQALPTDSEFQNMIPSPDTFASNYQYNTNVIARHTIFLHCIRNLVEARDRLNQFQDEEDSHLTLSDVPNITYQDQAVHITKTGTQILNQILQPQPHPQSPQFPPSHQPHQPQPQPTLTPTTLLHLFWLQYKKQILLIEFIFLLQIICKLTFSILLQELFTVVADIEAGDNMRKGYMMAACCGFLWFAGQILMHNGYYQAAIVVGRVRTELLFFVYAKLFSLTQFTANSQKLGKIINLLSSQFNSMESNLPIFFVAVVSPVGIIGILIILIRRFAWPGILIATTIILILPIQIYISKYNSNVIKQSNTHKDERVRICTEIIQGIKFIKLYSWQLAFNQMVQNLRKLQIRGYLKIAIGKSIEKSLNNITGNFAALFCFVVMDLGAQGSGLSAAKIFSTMELMVTLRLLLFFTVNSVNFLFQIRVTFQRFCSIFNIVQKRMVNIDLELMEQGQRPQKMKYEKQQTSSDDQDMSIILQNFNAYWDKKGPAALQNINIKIKKGSLIGITGKIGSGKSTILSTLLSQLPYYSGTIKITGDLAYVQQQPVIFSKSIRDNILFGAQFDQNRYSFVLEASCLGPDLVNMPMKDQTVVGERGITLSGGQKTRVVFARALYLDRDVYLFDDPMAAVDTKVGKKLYESILKMKGKKTVIFVTHQISYLFDCDQVLIMEDGKIIHQDRPQNLKNQLQKFQQSSNLPHQFQPNSTNNHPQIQPQSPQLLHQSTHQPQPQPEPQQPPNFPTSTRSPKLTPTSFLKYLLYTKPNYFIFPFCILLYILTEIINTVYFRILAEYDRVKDGRDGAVFGVGLGSIGIGIGMGEMSGFWVGLGLLQVGYFGICFFKYFLVNVVVLNSNQQIHRDMIYSIVRSPSSYFDTTSTGALTSKLSNDLSIMDTSLCSSLIDSIQGPIMLSILLANVIQIDKFFLIPTTLNLLLLLFFFLSYKNSIIAAKQLDLDCKTPIYNMVSEMLAGLVQMRISGSGGNDGHGNGNGNGSGRRWGILGEFCGRLDQALRGNLCLWNLNRAFGVVLSYVTIFMMWIGFVVGIGVVTSGTAGLYGVSIVFLMQICDRLNLLINQMTNLQNSTLSVSRIFGLTNLPPQSPLRTQQDLHNNLIPIYFHNEKDLEHQLTLQKTLPTHPHPHPHPQPETLPKTTQSLPYFQYEDQYEYEDEDRQKLKRNDVVIRVENFCMRYRQGLGLVLNDVGFEVRRGEKVGVVGRTGAGKSSLVQGLFRIYQPELGSVYELNGVDALSMGLHSLRQSISVIPQTPFLFNGTIKKNLDPFQIKSDDELWQALENSNLKQSIQKLPNKLNTDITQSSQIFSVGQKQLLCLTRALLRNTPYLILDEATSNVDLVTDSFIQTCLKTKFKDTTIITIAHRLHTVADYDRIIIMDKGRIVEMGSPGELVERRGIWWGMVGGNGEKGRVGEIQKIL